MSRWRSTSSEHQAACRLCVDLARLGCGDPDLARRWRGAVLAVRGQHAERTPVHGALSVLAFVMEKNLGPPKIAAAVGELWQALGCSLPPKPGVPRGRIIEPCPTPSDQALGLDAAVGFPSALTPAERQRVGAPVRHIELFAMAGDLDRQGDLYKVSLPYLASYFHARAGLYRRAALCAQALLTRR